MTLVANQVRTALLRQKAQGALQDRMEGSGGFGLWQV